MKARYDEGIFIGYCYLERNNIKLLYAFGHGLSYARFKYGNIKVSERVKYHYRVDVIIHNVGEYPGKEIVQLYVRDDRSVYPQPKKELKAFSKVSLAG